MTEPGIELGGFSFSEYGIASPVPSQLSVDLIGGLAGLLFAGEY